MNTRIILLSVALLALPPSMQGALYLFDSGTLNVPIPDGNPVGMSSTLNVSGIPEESDVILNLTATLNISGGFNSDLFGYLVAPNSTTVVLLNRIGIQSGNPFGNTGAGMNVTLANDDLTDYASIHDAPSGFVSGTYNPDNITSSLLDFNGSAATGEWRLFLADLSNQNESTLESWSLTIMVVPEPTTAAGLAFLAVLAGWNLATKCRRGKAPVAGKQSSSEQGRAPNEDR